MTTGGARDLDQLFASFDEVWSPRNVGRVDDYDVRIAKVAGEHVWHVHDDADEFFLCLEGRFTIHRRDGDVVLEPQQLYVVPRGVEHKPEAEPGTRILMFERRGTVTIGDRHDGSTEHIGVHAGIDLT